MTAVSKNRLIIVISSPSGAGKTSVCQKILERDKSIGLSISDTTRPARNNEINGIDYNFIEVSEFKQKIESNSYIEYANVFGNYYGSPHKNITDHFENNRDILFDIDWQGALQLRKSTFPNIVSIFIIPPSKDVIFERLKLRAKTSGDNLEAINNRMKEYETEMNHKDDYDYVVVNQEFEICVNEIERIINKSRNKLLIN
tara:strand:+ start:13482 stop:14081 length:600 start_codon:yes stop_codon:yes gene_type:complete